MWILITILELLMGYGYGVFVARFEFAREVCELDRQYYPDTQILATLILSAAVTFFFIVCPAVELATLLKIKLPTMTAAVIVTVGHFVSGVVFTWSWYRSAKKRRQT